jgi:uncharacterized protein with FMN-binding domain
MKPARPKLGMLEIGGRFALSFGLILASAASFRYHHKGSPVLKRTAGKISAEKPAPLSTDVSRPSRPDTTQTVPMLETPATATAPVLMNSKVEEVEPTHAHTPKAVRKHIYFYKDGDFVGSPVDIFYGFIQVSVSIRDGWITDVKWLMDPEDIDLSQQINHDAMPRLTKEAIKVQNAQVDMISGASFTVLGFRTSLATALAQATQDRNTP